jgi:Protein of unknown function (DUF2637)
MSSIPAPHCDKNRHASVLPIIATDVGRSLVNNLQDYFRPLGAEKSENDEAPSPHTDTWPGSDHQYGVFSGPDVDFLNGRWASEAELAQLLERVDSPEHDHPTPPFGIAVRDRSLVSPRHRKVRGAALRRPPNRIDLISCVIAVLTAVIVAVVGVLGGTVTHNPLRQLAEPGAPNRIAEWWPLLIYGPWLVASLSILRAALHQRRAPHSWCVVVLFSVFAVMLCVAHARMTPTGVAVAGLPPIAALACFQQLVRQITLTRPPRRTTGDRHGARRPTGAGARGGPTPTR